jgi:hypothetical protein
MFMPVVHLCGGTTTTLLILSLQDKNIING